MSNHSPDNAHSYHLAFGSLGNHPFMNPHVHPEELKENVYDQGNGLDLAKILKIEHRIYRRRDKDAKNHLYRLCGG